MIPEIADFVLPFQLENGEARGRLVRLNATLDDILKRHAYPEKVSVLLGEALAIAGTFGTALKFDGVFTLQAQGDGPVRFLVADVTSDGGLRACAHFDQARVTEAPLLGKGQLVFTVDQKENDERYQGMVTLESDSLVDATQRYFRQSEQIPTGVLVAARKDEQGHWQGGCLMLQRMPREGGLALPSDTSVEDDWHRAMLLMQTCSMDELVDSSLPPETLLYRLFHEEGVRVFDLASLRPQCRCSHDRVASMLRSLPREEIEALAVDGVVSISCEFCSRAYPFDKAEREAIYGQGG